MWLNNWLLLISQIYQVLVEMLKTHVHEVSRNVASEYLDNKSIGAYNDMGARLEKGVGARHKVGARYATTIVKP